MTAALRFRDRRGFALIVTLSLLALLMLAVVALSSLVRVGGQVSTAAAYQTQARQNALLGLRVGLSELQRQAGADTVVTANAGITGVTAGAANTTRHWCGVWRQDGSFVGWLTSGAQATPSPALLAGTASVELIAFGTVGFAASNSEHVIAGKLPVTVTETPGDASGSVLIGNYAYLVSDEGVKTPTYVTGALPVIPPAIFYTSTSSAQGKLADAVTTYASALPKVLAYEQLAVLPTPASSLTPSVLQDNFHHVTLTTRTVNGSVLQSGFVNPNTNSVYFWRNLLQTYNLAPATATTISASNVSAKGTSAQNTIAAFSTSGKNANGPFTSVTAVQAFLTSLFPASGSPTGTEIMTVLAPMLTVRSDTFRIRGYGESLNPTDPSKIESIAYCEAIVQRTTDTAPNGLGRRFVIIYFRWLGRDDV